MELSDKSKDFYELFRTVRNEMATEEGYVLEHAIRLTFDRFCANLLLADSLPLSELKNLLCNVSQLIQGWNATEAEWTEWDKEVQTKVHELQVKIDGLSAANFC